MAGQTKSESAMSELREGAVRTAKPAYGVDEPYTITSLTVMGLASMSSGIILQAYRGSTGQLVALFGLVAGFVVGLIFLVFAFSLLYSSRRWKLTELSAMASRLPLGGEERVLDIGCGRGAFSNLVAARLSAGFIVGLDVWNPRQLSGNHPASMLMNSEICGTTSKILLVKAHPSALPFVKNSFDVAISGMAFNRLESGRELQNAFKDVISILRQGGRVSFLVAGRSGPYVDEIKRTGMTDVEVERFRLGLLPPAHTITGRKPYRQ
ncbi:MAG: class I SAM-dependent methyltransferase [Thaumarchaeota archaeon]|nr:class I SAM-dependent methyltransferase [Nitrososphaerota archaeon]